MVPVLARWGEAALGAGSPVGAVVVAAVSLFSLSALGFMSENDLTLIPNFSLLFHRPQ